MSSVTKIFEETIATDHKVITEELSKSVLKKYGVKVPGYTLVNSTKEATKAAKRLGYPLVMKVVSPQILHKTDVGGVKVGLQNEKDVKKAFNDMYKRLSKKKGVQLKGILLEKMVPQGGELIVGLQNEPQFGPVIMVGLGGVLTEIFKDVAFRMLAISLSDAKSMLNELKGSEILKGFRGSKPIDINMLAKALVGIGKLGVDNAGHFDSIDFNPIVVYPKSYFVVDAKILLRKEYKKNAISKAKPDAMYMEQFFTPKSVALVGASATPGKIGNSVLNALGKQDYKGKVYPINPKQKSILGIKCYPSLDAIHAKIDLVVVCIDLAECGPIMKICAKKGIHTVVLVSGVGKEFGGERADYEAEVKRLALKHKIRLIDPRFFGLFK